MSIQKKSKAGRIRDLPPPRDRHPVYERLIRREGLRPLVLRDASAVYWDGFTILAGADRPSTGSSAPAREQLISMILGGEFGEDAKDVIIDIDRWEEIHDHLHYHHHEIIEREALSQVDFHLLDPAKLGESPVAAGPTTGPEPKSWTGSVTRDAEQPAVTYALQFGDRAVWKIGHAVDPTARLSEVNTHVPHEVLGEQWRLVLERRWPCVVDAFRMEQRVLTALRSSRSVRERVVCTRDALEEAWARALEDVT